MRKITLDKVISLENTVNLDLVIFLFLFLGGSIITINHAFNEFRIISDSAREYSTYLLFVDLKSQWWRPITGNILSTSLWTTYIPASIQRVLNLSNPEIVYRFFLGMMVATAPPMIYITVRRYATRVIACALVFYFFTSYYFVGMAEYGRMIVSVTFLAFTIYHILSHSRNKYFWIAAGMGGILTSHYTTALIYAIIFGLSFIGFASVNLLKSNGKAVLEYVPIPATMLAGIVLFYRYIAQVSSVWRYATGGINRFLAYFNTQLPAWITATSYPEPGSPAYYIFTTPVKKSGALLREAEFIAGVEAVTQKELNVDTRPIEAALQTPGPLPERKDSSFNINPFAGDRGDFIYAKALLFARAIIAGVVGYLLIKRGNWRHPLLYLYLTGVLIYTGSMWFPEIAAMLGSTRIPFVILPLELVALAWYSQGSEGTFKSQAIPFSLIVFSVAYH